MNYEQTLSYLFEHLPMFQRIGPAAYKKDLTNTLQLCALLNHPEKKFASVHIAGTNGKGSVSNMLASILFEAGYKTGLYTSPHLIDFRERIRVNGQLCEKEFVTGFTDKMITAIKDIQPSFFEITVAMAFDYFAEKEVDIAVIETGLGGRLDSTNVITPLLSIITNISYDHQNLLGNTLQEIAFEKAGIIKEHVPVVIGEFQEETFPVFLKKSNEMHSQLYLAAENVKPDLLENDPEDLVIHVSYLGQLLYPDLHSGLTGTYQLKNISTAIQSVEALRNAGIEISDDAVYEGIRNIKKNTGFSGRWQLLEKNPLVICDCAHNEGGLRAVFEQVKNIAYEKLHIVTGIVNDKDPRLVLPLYPVNSGYYFCRPDIPRGLDPKSLQKYALEYGLNGMAFTSVKDALNEAVKNAGKRDLVLICGSIFVAAEALSCFEELKKNKD